MIFSKSKKTVFYWGLAPTFSFLLIYCSIGYTLTGVIPFFEFSPPSTTFCLSIFTYFQHSFRMTGPFMKWFSLGLTSLAVLTVWIFRNRIRRGNFPLIMLLTFVLLYLFFYHITPEYLIFMLPLLAIAPSSIKSTSGGISIHILHGLLALSSTGFGIIYGLRIYSDGFGYRSPSKELFLKLYENSIGFLSLEFSERILLIVSVLTLLLMLIVVTKSVFQMNRIS